MSSGSLLIRVAVAYSGAPPKIRTETTPVILLSATRQRGLELSVFIVFLRFISTSNNLKTWILDLPALYSMPSLREIREILLFAHSDNLINDEEFLLLYDLNK